MKFCTYTFDLWCDIYMLLPDVIDQVMAMTSCNGTNRCNFMHITLPKTCWTFELCPKLLGHNFLGTFGCELVLFKFEVPIVLGGPTLLLQVHLEIMFC
jgi:hypothetical protein